MVVAMAHATRQLRHRGGETLEGGGAARRWVALEPAAQRVLLGERQLVFKALGIESPIRVRTLRLQTVCLQRQDDPCGLDIPFGQLLGFGVLGEKQVAAVFDDQGPRRGAVDPRHPNSGSQKPARRTLIAHDGVGIVALVENQDDGGWRRVAVRRNRRRGLGTEIP